MRVTELRIGNAIHYHMVDKYDERKECDELNIVDVEDLLWLYENVNDGEYKPIPLTEEWLVKLGMDKISSGDFPVYCKGNVIVEDLSSISLRVSAKISFSIRLAVSTSLSYGIRSIDSVHELQNIYWCLTGEELTIKE